MPLALKLFIKTTMLTTYLLITKIKNIPSIADRTIIHHTYGSLWQTEPSAT